MLVSLDQPNSRVARTDAPAVCSEIPTQAVWGSASLVFWVAKRAKFEAPNTQGVYSAFSGADEAFSVLQDVYAVHSICALLGVVLSPGPVPFCVERKGPGPLEEGPGRWLFILKQEGNCSKDSQRLPFG